MKASRFSLADLLTLLGTIAFGFICFLGLNFITEGDILTSSISAIVIALLLGGFALMAKLLKKARRNFKAHIIAEISCITIFTILFWGITIFLFPHYFTVSSKKKLIKESLLTSIDGATKMFDEYESYANNREAIYMANLKSAVAAKKTRPSDYANYGLMDNDPNGIIKDNDKIESKRFMLHASLFPTNYSDTASRKGTKDVAIKWLNEQINVVSLWKPIGIPNVAKKLAAKASEWCSILNGYSKYRGKGETTQDFSYKLHFEDVSPLLTEMEHPSFISILLSIAIYVVMLLSWLITKRDSKFIGINKTFGQQTQLDNEL